MVFGQAWLAVCISDVQIYQSGHVFIVYPLSCKKGEAKSRSLLRAHGLLMCMDLVGFLCVPEGKKLLAESRVPQKQ